MNGAIVSVDSRLAPHYPRYVQSLRQSSAEVRAEMAALNVGLDDLTRYLTSAKFAGDGNGWVSVADVLLRLQEARSSGLAAGVMADANQPGGWAA